MSIKLSQLAKESSIEKVIMHSLEGGIYQASVVLKDGEHLVTETNGKYLREKNCQALQDKFKGMKVKNMVLRQETPYEEMIGQSLYSVPFEMDMTIHSDS